MRNEGCMVTMVTAGKNVLKGRHKATQGEMSFDFLLASVN